MHIANTRLAFQFARKAGKYTDVIGLAGQQITQWVLRGLTAIFRGRTARLT